jgi:hypothetical protein
MQSVSLACDATLRAFKLPLGGCWRLKHDTNVNKKNAPWRVFLVVHILLSLLVLLALHGAVTNVIAIIDVLPCHTVGQLVGFGLRFSDCIA